MFIMRQKVALTLQSVNKIPVRVTIEVKANKYYFHAELFITYFKVVVLWGYQYKRKKKKVQKTRFNRSDEGLTLETSAFSLFTVANLRFQPSC